MQISPLLPSWWELNCVHSNMNPRNIASIASLLGVSFSLAIGLILYPWLPTIRFIAVMLIICFCLFFIVYLYVNKKTKYLDVLKTQGTFEKLSPFLQFCADAQCPTLGIEFQKFTTKTLLLKNKAPQFETHLQKIWSLLAHYAVELVTHLMDFGQQRLLQLELDRVKLSLQKGGDDKSTLHLIKQLENKLAHVQNIQESIVLLNKTLTEFNNQFDLWLTNTAPLPKLQDIDQFLTQVTTLSQSGH